MHVYASDGTTDSSSLDAKLDSGKVDGWLKQLRPKEGDVALPRFKMTDEFDRQILVRLHEHV